MSIHYYWHFFFRDGAPDLKHKLPIKCLDFTILGHCTPQGARNWVSKTQYRWQVKFQGCTLWSLSWRPPNLSFSTPNPYTFFQVQKISAAFTNLWHTLPLLAITHILLYFFLNICPSQWSITEGLCSAPLALLLNLLTCHEILMGKLTNIKVAFPSESTLCKYLYRW